MDGRVVVRLDRRAELHVDRVDLAQDVLGLSLLRRNGWIRGRAADGHERRRYCHEESLRLSFPRICHQQEPNGWRTGGGRYVTSCAP